MREVINVVFTLSMAIISVILYNIFYAKINNHKIIWNIKKIILILVISVMVLLSNMILPVAFKIAFNFLCLNIELKIIFKDSIKKTVINYTCIYFIFSFFEIFITKILLESKILINNTSANSINYINLILTVLIGGIQYLIVTFSPTKHLVQNLIRFFLENKPITIIIFLISLTVTLISMIYIENFTDENTFRLILLLIIIFAILFILIIRSKYHEETLKIFNKKLIDYNDNYGKFLDEYKIYKHNIKNKLVALKPYGNKKINSLIDDLLEEETEFSFRNNNIYSVPNGIKGIVAEKLYSKDYSIVINNKIKNDPFDHLKPHTFNSISECLGVALDNAIEASRETKNPVITMDLKEDKETIFIKIGNNFSNIIDISNIGNKYYSTKNRESGLGLFSIFQNKTVNEKIEIINNFYFIELQVKKQNR